jgi:hypothetical protein
MSTYVSWEKKRTPELLRELVRNNRTQTCKVSTHLCRICDEAIVMGDRFRRSGNSIYIHEECFWRR